jgi:hypothetical protein
MSETKSILISSAVKYEVDVTEEMVSLLNGLDDDWKKFLSILEETEQELKRKGMYYFLHI